MMFVSLIQLHCMLGRLFTDQLGCLYLFCMSIFGLSPLFAACRREHSSMTPYGQSFTRNSWTSTSSDFIVQQEVFICYLLTLILHFFCALWFDKRNRDAGYGAMTCIMSITACMGMFYCALYSCRGSRPSRALVGAGCSSKMQVAQGQGGLCSCTSYNILHPLVPNMVLTLCNLFFPAIKH